MSSSDLSPTANQVVADAQTSEPSLNDLASQVPKPSLEGSMLESRTFAPKKGTTLTQRLLTFVLPTAIVPLVLAGGFQYVSVQGESQTKALEALELESALAGEKTTKFIANTFIIPEVISVEPVMQAALLEGGRSAVALDLNRQPIDVLEEQFSDKKLLAEDEQLNRFLRDVVRLDLFSEIFITEQHGFNIAYSNPTSDFVQRDEDWWQVADQRGQYVGSPELDESSGVIGVELAQAVTDTKTGKFLGVIKAVAKLDELTQNLSDFAATAGNISTSSLRVLDVASNQVVADFNYSARDEVKDSENVALEEGVAGEIEEQERQVNEVFGLEHVEAIAQQLDVALKKPDQPLENIQGAIEIETSLSAKDLELKLDRLSSASGEAIFSALFKLEGYYYSIHTIPGTKWVSMSALEESVVQAEGLELLQSFSLTTLLLAVLSTAVLILLSRRLSAPLQSLTAVAQAAASGQLDARAKLEGTVETQTLGEGFNTLLNQTQTLLKKQAENAEEQARQRQALEDEIADLMEDVGDAADGDLRVRAKLSDGDVGIVADLFNSIIENLRITTQKVKDSTGQVSTSLLENEATVLDLSAQAVEEAESLKDTMEAVEEISKSIDEVAANANQASALTQDTYATVQVGAESMDQTVESILGLRSTVGETAKKIKRLGESAQKISQAVSLIDEIALKTNLLAVNASVEAARAGEMGQGFTAVAEQVGSLAEQSAAATKEIAQIVAGIQTETQEVVEAIETGTAQVVDSTSLVETTKTRLAEVLLKSEQINRLMAQISASAQYQSESSAAVSDLVKEAAESSAQRSKSSQEMAKSIQETAKVAQNLEASVEQFKLED